MSECASAADANPQGCGGQLAAQPFVVIEDGAGSVPFTVMNRAAVAPLSSGETTACSTGCVLVATAGAYASGLQVVVAAPIAFAP